MESASLFINLCLSDGALRRQEGGTEQETGKQKQNSGESAWNKKSDGERKRDVSQEVRAPSNLRAEGSRGGSFCAKRTNTVQPKAEGRLGRGSPASATGKEVAVPNGDFCGCATTSKKNFKTRCGVGRFLGGRRNQARKGIVTEKLGSRSVQISKKARSDRGGDEPPTDPEAKA
jgi:hypothetical protein